MKAPLWMDRRAAGKDLAEALMSYRGTDTLVLGIPRGGLVVAAEVARILDAELDAIVVSKLSAPHARENTIGAVTANGGRLLDLDAIHRYGLSEVQVAVVTQVQRGAALGREAWLRSFRDAAPVTGRTVIVVDDGVQTGASMRAAVAAVRRRLPARVIAAVPCGSSPGCRRVARDVDELICLQCVPRLDSLDVCYRRIQPPGEAEMRALLERRAPIHA
jgi:putative phosphoribosyl transferase